MRKAEKRRIGEIKQAKNREESRASGLLAQRQDQKARERKHRDNLIKKDKQSKIEKNIAPSPDLLNAMAEEYLAMHGMTGEEKEVRDNIAKALWQTDPTSSAEEDKLLNKLFPEFR